MPEKPRNVGASVRMRLLILAHARGQPLELLLTRYALERLLAPPEHLATSPSLRAQGRAAADDLVRRAAPRDPRPRPAGLRRPLAMQPAAWRRDRPRRLPPHEGIPAGPTFFKNVIVGGGPAPVRAYIDELLPDVLGGLIQPGRVFDRTVGLRETPQGYRAMDEREAIKVLIKI